MRIWSGGLLLGIGVIGLAQSAFAQATTAPIIRKGVVEAGGFVGASYGIDQARVMGGGNVVYSLTTTLMPLAEVSYFPGIGRTFQVPGSSNLTATFSTPLTDFNFGFHLRIPIPRSRIIPYGVISAGGIHSPNQVISTSKIVSGQTLKTDVPIGARTDFAFSGGGGIRYYATERMGFRVEFKAYKPSGAYTDPFYRVAGGFFFQF